jgi:hypothetical protein
MTDFTKLKVGTMVWAIDNGWGVITKIDTHDGYNVRVLFNNGNGEDFTKDGKRYEESPLPSLFLNKFEIPKEANLPNLKVDDKVVVWMSGMSNDRHKRYFKRFDKGCIVCFYDGKTSFSDTGQETTWDWFEVVNE